MEDSIEFLILIFLYTVTMIKVEPCNHRLILFLWTTMVSYL
nr:MAG TPA_asm: hypothetical protein [Caudoviricetes sp.]